VVLELLHHRDKTPHQNLGEKQRRNLSNDVRAQESSLDDGNRMRLTK
jgi:hypothetical protein